MPENLKIKRLMNRTVDLNILRQPDFLHLYVISPVYRIKMKSRVMKSKGEKYLNA